MFATFSKGLTEGIAARERATKETNLQGGDKNDLQQLEGKIQAIGNGYSKRFDHFTRHPALLEPPAVAPSVRQQVLGKASRELLEQIGFQDDELVANVGGEQSSQIRNLVGSHVKHVVQRAMWRESMNAPPAFDGQRGGGTASSDDAREC